MVAKGKLIKCLMRNVELFNRYRRIHNIKKLDLSGANLREADLEGTNLSGANLHATDLYEADLRKANLKGADLYEADLTGADLYKADLTRANLRGADLYEADLTATNLRGAENYYAFLAFDTSKRIVHCIKHKDGWMIMAGCFWGTLEELEKKVKETHNSKVYLANIEILKNL